MNGAVFLDRDGTIIEDKDYLHRPEEVVIYPGVGAALKRLQDVGFKLFIVTNQSGVGRGKFPLEDVHRVNEHLCRELAKDGVRFEKIYIAPEAPGTPSRGRKPSPQFLFDARDEFGLDLAQCYMIGDKLIDLECGWNAGVKRSLLVRTGYGVKVAKDCNKADSVIADDLPAAAGWIGMQQAICGGKITSRTIGDWSVTWEGNESYRHWALLEQMPIAFRQTIAVVMLNPGSLVDDGKRLASDTTLQILRHVFKGTRFRCLILNLFDLANTQPKELGKSENWERRDSGECELIYEKAVQHFKPVGVLYAYGECKPISKIHPQELQERIDLVKKVFRTQPTVWPPEGEQSSHPRRWRIEMRTEEVRAGLHAMKPFHIIGIIPARYASTRFPAKPLAMIAGKPLIQHVVEQCQKAKSLREVIVATDDERIAAVARQFCRVEMTRADHPSGSDRIAEVAARCDCDAVVNIQGDEPMIDPAVIDAVANALSENEMSTAATRIRSVEEHDSPNVVKVVVSASGRALYFSRRTIPFVRDAASRSSAEQLAAFPFLKHLGIYGYRRETLLRLVKFPVSPLESAEKLEQLRALENGIGIAVVQVDYDSVGVDVPEDVGRVEGLLRKSNR